MVTEVSDIALLNALFPIDVSVLVPSNVMEVSAQEEKAISPIDVTLAGMVMEVSAVAP